MTRCCTHACNQGRNCPARLWSRVERDLPAPRKSAPLYEIAVLASLAVVLMAVGVM